MLIKFIEMLLTWIVIVAITFFLLCAIASIFIKKSSIVQRDPDDKINENKFFEGLDDDKKEKHIVR